MLCYKIYWSKDFSTELNCKKSLNLIQYLEEDILNYSSTGMFRGTTCSSRGCNPFLFGQIHWMLESKRDLHFYCKKTYRNHKN